MAFGKKKKKEMALEEAQRIVREAAQQEEDNDKEIGTIDTGDEDTTQSTTQQKPHVTKELQELVKYYQEKHPGIFNQEDFLNPDVLQCNLLFSIWAELKEIKETLRS